MEFFKAPMKVNMLGAFSFYEEDKLLVEDQGKSRKVWNLFAYLVFNREKKLSSTELPDILCSDERIEDPVKAVKNLVYRLRGFLAESDMPEEDYIKQSGGIYSWNNEIPLKLDIDEFVQKYKQAKAKGVSREEAIQGYMAALDLYKGKFLPRLSYEEWTVTFRVYYHRIYTDCIKEVFKLLTEKNEYAQMVEICEKAILLDPYDEEIYTIYISSLVSLNMEKQAIKAYEEITERLYNELGINPSDELKKMYRQIIKRIKTVDTDLMNIKSDLNEEGNICGTFCTDYEIFKDIYRFMARSVDRTGSSVFIMLCTITYKNEEIPKVEHLKAVMDKTKIVISSVLRKGDLFAKYSVSQYIIILPGTSYENGVHVGERIMTAYGKQNINKDLQLNYKLQPLDPKISLKEQ